jgi:phage tail-like protein
MSEATPVGLSLVDGLPESFVAAPGTADVVRAFDDGFAAFAAVVDHLPAYVDARYAPDEMVRWVASWLAPTVAARRSAAHLRRHLDDLVTTAVARGSVRAVVAAVRACTGLEPDVQESGGVAWSRRPGGPMPGSSSPRLQVGVRLSPDERDPDDVLDLVRSLVDLVRPVHVPTDVHRIA